MKSGVLAQRPTTVASRTRILAQRSPTKAAGAAVKVSCRASLRQRRSLSLPDLGSRAVTSNRFANERGRRKRAVCLDISGDKPDAVPGEKTISGSSAAGQIHLGHNDGSSSSSALASSDSDSTSTTRDFLPYGYLFLTIQFTSMTVFGILAYSYATQTGWQDPAYLYLTAIMTSGLTVLIFISQVLRSAAKRNRLKGGTFQTLNLCIIISSVLSLISFYDTFPLCISPCFTLPIAIWGYVRGLRQAGGNAIKFSPLCKLVAPYLSLLYWMLMIFCLVISWLHTVLGATMLPLVGTLYSLKLASENGRLNSDTYRLLNMGVLAVGVLCLALAGGQLNTGVKIVCVTLAAVGSLGLFFGSSGKA